MTADLILYIPVFCLVAITIASKYKFKQWYKFLKPISLIIIIFLPIVRGVNNFNLYNLLIFLGLIFSLIGDIFLLSPRKYFNAGTAAFMITHLIYSYAFAERANEFTAYSLAPFAIFGTGYFIVIKKDLGKYKIPVLIYVIIICLMGSLGLNYYLTAGGNISFYVLIGAILFIVSDSALAWNKFAKSFYAAEVIILSTYYSAQFLFVLTIR